MPGRYPAGEAATICATLKQRAEKFIEEKYAITGPPTMAVTLENDFINEMTRLLQLLGGRVTRTARYPNTPIAPYGTTILPNNGGCM
jgi:hypothetical protein